MHIGHRMSEDLDLITRERRLPRAALDTLIVQLEQAGFAVVRADDETAYEEFLIAGESLHDYQQDFLINGVKVSIVSPSIHWVGALDPSVEPFVRVASLTELFRLKALAASERSLSRDWIDLYLLFKEHGFSISDFQQAFKGPGIHYPDQAISQAFQNLCRGIKSAIDPGYETLIDNAPSLDELAAFFKSMRDQYQIDQSRLKFEQQKHIVEP